MSKLISMLGALALAAITNGALAEDAIKAGGKTTETQGHALDEVKAGGKTRETHGRTVDEEKYGKMDSSTQRTVDSDSK